MSASEDESQGPVSPDRGRIDLVTGQPQESAEPADSAEPGSAETGNAEQSAQASASSSGAAQPRPGKHAASKPGAAQRVQAAGDTGHNGSGETGGGSAAGGSAGGGSAAGQAGSGQSQPSADSSADAAPAGRDVAVMLAERTADLQRLQAEYVNYRKRVERDRAAVREQSLAAVLAELLPVLDDIGRAREHGELTGGFRAVAESLEGVATKLGLSTYGEVGEEFDPNVHEALMHSYSPDVTDTTCVQILQPGYKVGERILRPARVAVAEPSDPAGARPASAGSAAEADGGGQTDQASGEEPGDRAEIDTD
jgi:molecular chaperone GrpE